MPSFTINCSAADWPRAKELFLKGAPNQTTEANDPVPMTDDEWVEYKILLMVKNQVVRGLRIEQEEQAEQPADDFFTIS